MNPTYAKAIRVLTRALVIIADRWTNRGFKIKQDDGSYKVDVIGAISVAQSQLFGSVGSDAYRDSDLAINLINDAALKHFRRSAVSVNDDLGYLSTIKLYALAIERGINYGFGTDPDIGRFEYKTNRIASRAGEK
jgi:hypothetical protein